MDKAEYKKSYREKLKEERRFNKVVNKYLKIKYEGIYEECCEFYRDLKQKNPQVKDLTKTTRFKKWVRKQQNERDDDDDDDEPITLVTYKLSPGEETATATSFEQILQNDERNNGEQQQQDHSEGNAEGETATSFEQQQDHDIIEQIINELGINQDVHNILNEPLQQDQDRAAIDSIINELELDHELYNALNVPPQDYGDDEGIGLNLEDEIEDPFDFSLEVDF